MTHLDTTIKTIFQLSSEEKDLSKAFKEWVYEGNMHDTGESTHVCELCGQTDLRFQFEIRNIQNQNSLLIGSECIKKFNSISVLDSDGNKLDVVSARKKVDSDRRSLVTDAKKRHVINSLVQLSWKDEDSDYKIEDFIKYLNDRGAFTPDQLAFLFWRLDVCNVSFQKSYFKLVMKRNRERTQLLTMPEWKLRKIEDTFSSSQRLWVKENRV